MRPAKPFKLLPPDVPAALLSADALDECFFLRLAEQDDIEATRFTGVRFENLAARRAAFRGCVFEKCAFAQDEELPIRYDFVDCVFANCDFAGMRFEKCEMRRCALARCRGVGATFTGAVLRSVTMDECQMAYSGFGMAKLTGVEMTACDFSHSSFGYAALEQVKWDACKLTAAELFSVRLKDIDLRTNELDGIVVGDRRELEGAIVTPLQACELAKLLGVVVMD